MVFLPVPTVLEIKTLEEMVESSKPRGRLPDPAPNSPHWLLKTDTAHGLWHRSSWNLYLERAASKRDLNSDEVVPREFLSFQKKQQRILSLLFVILSSSPKGEVQHAAVFRGSSCLLYSRQAASGGHRGPCYSRLLVDSVRCSVYRIISTSLRSFPS